MASVSSMFDVLVDEFAEGLDGFIGDKECLPKVTAPSCAKFRGQVVDSDGAPVPRLLVLVEVVFESGVKPRAFGYTSSTGAFDVVYPRAVSGDSGPALAFLLRLVDRTGNELARSGLYRSPGSVEVVRFVLPRVEMPFQVPSEFEMCVALVDEGQAGEIGTLLHTNPTKALAKAQTAAAITGLESDWVLAFSRVIESGASGAAREAAYAIARRDSDLPGLVELYWDDANDWSSTYAAAAERYRVLEAEDGSLGKAAVSALIESTAAAVANDTSTWSFAKFMSGWSGAVDDRAIVAREWKRERDKLTEDSSAAGGVKRWWEHADVLSLSGDPEHYVEFGVRTGWHDGLAQELGALGPAESYADGAFDGNVTTGMTRTQWKTLLASTSYALPPTYEALSDGSGPVSLTTVEARARYLDDLYRAFNPGSATLSTLNPSLALGLGPVDGTLDLRSGRIEQFVPSGTVPADAQVFERRFHVSPSVAGMAALESSGAESAGAVLGFGRDGFSEAVNNDQGGAVYAGARTVHRQAQHMFLAARDAAESESLSILGRSSVMGGPATGLPAGVQIGSGALGCSVPHCQSVFSPGAYLVDVLSWLGQLGPGSGGMRSRLFARRPDIAVLEISCANTEDELPYAQIATEVMNARVAKAIDDDSSLGSLSVANTAAPAGMPFDSLAVQPRLWLEAAGTSLRQLRTMFVRGVDEDEQGLERVNWLGAERTAFHPTPDVGRLWGFDSATWVEELRTNAAEFLARAELSWDELEELVEWGTPLWPELGISRSAAAPCDAQQTAVATAAISADELSAIKRMLVLRDRLGGTIEQWCRALYALGCGAMSVDDIAKLGRVQLLADEFGVALTETLPVLIEQQQRLGATPDKSASDTFRDAADSTGLPEGDQPVTPDELAGLGPVLQATLGCSGEEWEAYVADVRHAGVSEEFQIHIDRLEAELLFSRLQGWGLAETRVLSRLLQKSLAGDNASVGIGSFRLFADAAADCRSADATPTAVAYMLAVDLPATQAHYASREDVWTYCQSLQAAQEGEAGVAHDVVLGLIADWSGLGHATTELLCDQLSADAKAAVSDGLLEILQLDRVDESIALCGEALEGFRRVAALVGNWEITEEQQLRSELGYVKQAGQRGWWKLENSLVSHSGAGAAFIAWRATERALGVRGDLRGLGFDWFSLDARIVGLSGPPLVQVLADALGVATEEMTVVAAAFKADLGAGDSAEARTMFDAALSSAVSALRYSRRKRVSAAAALAVANAAETDLKGPSLLLARTVLGSGFEKAEVDVEKKLVDRARHAVLSWLQYVGELGSPEELYGELLIDPEMSSCRKATRVQEAILATQLFVHRWMLGLELDGTGEMVPPTKSARERWEWLRAYRVWEVNRKVFLYPENWIEPDLRDTKTPLFKSMEEQLLQGEIDGPAVERAYGRYLSGLSKIANLTPVAVFDEAQRDYIPFAYGEPGDLHPTWLQGERASGTFHVVARTAGTPHEHFHRTRTHGEWTPWTKIELPLLGTPLSVAVVRNRKILTWCAFEVSDPETRMPGPEETPTVVEPRSLMRLVWSEFVDGAWSAPRQSDTALRLFGAEAELRRRTMSTMDHPDFRNYLTGGPASPLRVLVDTGNRSDPNRQSAWSLNLVSGRWEHSVDVSTAELDQGGWADVSRSQRGFSLYLGKG